MSDSTLARYWIAILAVCGFGAFMWWRSRDAEYVESRPPGVYKAYLVGFQNQRPWIAPALVAFGLIGMTIVTILG
jgi:hypothetical protein